MPIIFYSCRQHHRRLACPRWLLYLPVFPRLLLCLSLCPFLFLCLLQVIPSSRIADEAALADAVDAAGVGDPHAVLPRAAALAADALYEAAVLGHADPAGDASTSSASAAPGVEVVAYAFDVLPASSVALLVTNTGAAAPKQVRRLHDELYG